MNRTEILIVDDEEGVRESVSRILQSKGYGTATASGPHEALAAVGEIRPDLVLTDIKMPDMDGVTLAQEIKRRYPETPVVLMTAYASVDTAIQSLKLGVDDYIRKPIDWEQAMVSIQTALKKRITTLQNRKYVEDLQRELLKTQCSQEATLLGTVRGLFTAGDRSRRSMLDTVESLALAMGAKDTVTKDHSRRVAVYVAKMATALSFSEEEVGQFRLAGLLHDIGKIGIPNEILEKPIAEMTEQERALYKEHPVMSCRILQPVREFEPILGAIRHHHERFDGTGYPDGLSGEHIPIGARMIAVADVVSDLAVEGGHDECIHEAFAIERLMVERGTRFDPYIVDTFIEAARAIAHDPPGRAADAAAVAEECTASVE